MGYCFCLGASGAGKSTYLHREVIRRAGKALSEGRYADSFLLIVPDQFTMQTQKELVLAAGDRAGIMNVDVLSFGRLTHRIFEEVGADARGTLDDMGKSLILRRLSMRHGKKLKVLDRRISRPGMITEVKSVISEFMQYGISDEGVGELAAYAAKNGQGALAAKLLDLQVLYRAFLEERSSRFLTGEEQLDVLAEAIPHSGLIGRSCVIFDDFTGFTPIQYRVILALMQCAGEVVFVLDWGEDGGTPFAQVVGGAPWDEQDLFSLSRKTAAQISRMAQKAGIRHDRDLLIGLSEDSACIWQEAVPHRFRANPAMAHLERSIFRYPVRPYLSGPSGSDGGAPGHEKKNGSGETLPVHLVLSSNPAQEARQMCIRIRKLIAENGWQFRDFAVVAGDLDAYEDEIRVYAARYDIPVYIDSSRRVLQNPLMETLRSGLEIGAGDYGYETMFRFLRSGLTGLSLDSVDRLENYCLARGIVSKKRWETAFDSEFEPARQYILDILTPLRRQMGRSIPDRTRALYDFLRRIRAGERMKERAERFRREGQDAAAMEYEQLYGAVIHLLEELYDLPGDAPVSAKDYRELVETGFGEIRLGTLPQKADRVLVGDIERTRLCEVKVLFLLGVNDGNIPKGVPKGGLLSDLDREFLQESETLRGKGYTLAPTPRQQMGEQRLYLYMIMTKLSRELYVSYAAAAADGGSIRPSYLIGLLRQLFPQLRTERPENDPVCERLIAPKDAAGFLSGALRDYADGRLSDGPGGADEVLTLYGFCAGREADTGGHIRELGRAAFMRYRPSPVRRETAELLYGRVVRGSATRLETAAQCYLRHFLQYGLRLREREVYTFVSSDAGTILHESVQRFGQLLGEEGLSWRSYTPRQGRELAARALGETAAQYNDQILYATARSSAQAGRMQRILERTVDTLQFQLLQGDYEPAESELDFGGAQALRYRLSGGGELVIRGRIDRVDLARSDGRLSVRIVDYKSGDRDLDPKQIRAGLQLQLMLYMEAELMHLRRRFPGTQILPAALLYYHFDDPVLTAQDARKVLAGGRDALRPADCPGGNAPEKGQPPYAGDGNSGAEGKGTQRLREELLHRRLRPRGLVRGEPELLRQLDHTLADPGTDSLAVPVKTKRDGTPDARSSVISGEEYDELSDAVRRQVCRIAEDILSGRADASPVHLDRERTACTWCPYRDACGFDPRIPGYTYREI